MTKMFKSITRTWNPFVGCTFECYNGGCWARKTALEKLNHLPRYSDGFTPKLVPKELNKRFQPGEFVAVSLMGDISFATKEEVSLILNVIEQFPLTNFLIQSKNPKKFYEWKVDFSPNIYLGTTLETNRDYKLTKAPPPINRYMYLASYPHTPKFLSIEPIMDFDITDFMRWILLLKPIIIEVGADNYNNHLPEPSWVKVKELLNYLKDEFPRVIEKDGLDRLKYARE